LDCDASPADLYPKALGYDLSTRITLNLNNADNPLAIPNKQYQIMGITHDWQAWKNCWHTTWQLWDVNQYKMVHNIMTSLSGLENDGVNYTTVHNAANAASATNSPVTSSFNIGQANAGGPEINRALIVLDSSGIPASPAMTSASLFLNIVQPGNTAPLTLCLVLHGAVNYPVVVSNYGDLLGQTAILGSAAIPANFSGPLEIPLNALGLTAINVGSSTTFALRSLDDINAVAPTGDAMAVVNYAVGNAYWAIRFSL